MTALSARWKGWTEGALALLYPNVCQLCGLERAGAAEGYVCNTCWQQVRFIVPPFCRRCGLPFEGDITVEFECSNCRDLEFHFAWARAAVAAAGPVREAIHRYKYNGSAWFEAFLGDLLTRQAARELHPADWDFIAPVPLHRVRQREREFNQAERLAQRLSAATGIPVRSDMLARTQPTNPQALLSKQERARNVLKAFALRAGKQLNGARVLIVDDVLTTGATTSACAKALRDGGAEMACVWTVARGL